MSRTDLRTARDAVLSPPKGGGTGDSSLRTCPRGLGTGQGQVGTAQDSPRDDLSPKPKQINPKSSHFQPPKKTTCPRTLGTAQNGEKRSLSHPQKAPRCSRGPASSQGEASPTTPDSLSGAAPRENWLIAPWITGFLRVGRPARHRLHPEPFSRKGPEKRALPRESGRPPLCAQAGQAPAGSGPSSSREAWGAGPAAQDARTFRWGPGGTRLECASPIAAAGLFDWGKRPGILAGFLVEKLR